jgi:hypothetical protein
LIGAVPDHDPGTIALAGEWSLARGIEAVFAVKDVPGAICADDEAEPDVHAELAIGPDEASLGDKLKVSSPSPERSHAWLLLLPTTRPAAAASACCCPLLLLCHRHAQQDRPGHRFAVSIGRASWLRRGLPWRSDTS